MHRVSLLSSIARMPRAIQGVKAEADTPAMIRAIAEAQQQHNSTTATTLAALESGLNAHAVKLAALGLGGSSGGSVATDPVYSTPFASWFRTGGGEDTIRTANATGDRARIQAAMTEGNNGDGGYLTPTEWDRKINQALVNISPLRKICDVRHTKVAAYSTLWKLTGPGTGWVGETAARPPSTTPTFAQIVFGHGEIYSNAGVSQRMLDDADFDVAAWLATDTSDEFGKQEAIAFLTGDGVNKPNGLLQHGTGGAFAAYHPAGAVPVVASQRADGLTADGLVDFSYQVPAPYRQNATWLMNSNTGATVAKMKDGQGNYIWRESFLVGQPATLLGRPVEFDENLPNVAAGTTPIVYGDFKAGYVINDRGTARVLRDPYTNKPYVMFYVTKRVGGGVKDPNAFRILKVSAN